MSFLGANFQSIAMEPFARIAGSAASILSFIRVFVGTLLGIMIGQAFDGTSRPLMVSMLAAALGTLLLVLWSEDGQAVQAQDGAGMSDTFDIAVIGGGVNGAGIARDAAGRGAKVLLLEARDLASGTSSASTKLIHGGLRYLE